MGIHQSLSLSRSPRISAFSLWIKVVSISRRAFHSLASMSRFFPSFFLPLLSLSLSCPFLLSLFLFFFFFLLLFSVLGVSSGRFFGVTVYIEQRLEGKRGCRERKLYRGISVDLRLTARLSHWSVKFNGESLNILARAVRRKILWAVRNIRDIVSRVYFTVEKEFRSGEEGED